MSPLSAGNARDPALLVEGKAQAVGAKLHRYDLARSQCALDARTGGDSRLLARATALLQQALAANPKDAHVYVQAARVTYAGGHINYNNYEPGSLELADALVDKALVLDPENAHAHDYVLTTQVTVAGLQATAGVRLNLHAGGLADDRGRVLALVGPSGTGKTTATRTLAGRLGYLSDETVSMDAGGRVFPHA